MTDETTPGPGHNSIGSETLRAFIERIERLEDEKKALQEDIRAVFAEAKAGGFDPKIMRKVLRLRAMDAADRREEAALVDMYCHALGLDDLFA